MADTEDFFVKKGQKVKHKGEEMEVVEVAVRKSKNHGCRPEITCKKAGGKIVVLEGDSLNDLILVE